MHSNPVPGFCVFNGHYYPRCRSSGVPRFVCKVCRKGFSRQTFRSDYRDHRPHLNVEVFRLLASGLGLRQTSRLVGLTLRCTELKFRKIARHLAGSTPTFEVRCHLARPCSSTSSRPTKGVATRDRSPYPP